MEEFKYLVPEESIDAAGLDGTKLRTIEQSLRAVFNEHSYEELMLPTFEYLNLYNGLDVEESSMFQFTNHEGKRIALRTDFTVPIARLYNNENTNKVRRYSYFGKVFQTQQRHKGRSSELFQGGIELIGQGGVKGDLECLQLIQETMPLLGLSNLKLELSSAKFYRRLVSIVGDRHLITIIDKKQLSEMEKFVKAHGIEGELKNLLLYLPQAFGDVSVLKKVKSLAFDDRLIEAIDELETLYNALDDHSQISFDLCKVPRQSYYTGILINGYSYYSAQPILSGGRYDNLLNYFNNHVPSIGFVYYLNNVMDAITKEGEAND